MGAGQQGPRKISTEDLGAPSGAEGVRPKLREGHQYAAAYPIMGNLVVMTRMQPAGKKDIPDDPLKFQKKDLSMVNNQKKRRRERWKRISEGIQIDLDADRMLNAVKNNIAALKHLIVFRGLARYGINNGFKTRFLIFKKQFPEKNAKEEWSKIRSWIASKVDLPLVMAVTVGRNPNGWWTLRVLMIGEESLKKLEKYLTKTRGWKIKESSDDDLIGHYLMNLTGSEETFRFYVPEMYEVYRASLSFPKMRRTLLTAQADKIIKSSLVPVANSAAYPVCAGGRPGRALCLTVQEENGIITQALHCDEAGLFDDDEDEDDE